MKDQLRKHCGEIESAYKNRDRKATKIAITGLYQSLCLYEGTGPVRLDVMQRGTINRRKRQATYGRYLSAMSESSSYQPKIRLWLWDFERPFNAIIDTVLHEYVHHWERQLHKTGGHGPRFLNKLSELRQSAGISEVTQFGEIQSVAHAELFKPEQRQLRLF